MKFLFTAPRFHTNQVPIVNGLIKKGHEVKYFVVFKGKVEDHSVCDPILLKPSKSFNKKWNKFKKQYILSDVESMVGGQFIPDYTELKKEFLSYMPDVVICREKTNLTACVYKLCVENNIPCILYDQNPYLIQKELKKTQVVKKHYSVFQRFSIKINRYFDKDFQFIKSIKDTMGFPKVRITPVMLSDASVNINECEPDKNAYFVPLVYENDFNIDDKKYFKNNIVNLLCVAKYREYKNLPLLIDAINLIKDRNDFKLTILGQAKLQDEIEYKSMLQKKINDFGLQDKINLIENVLYNEMGKIYIDNDVLILPTKKEHASVALLEAMSYGLAVISTDMNGTASYINFDKNGYIFKTMDSKDLADKIVKILESNIELFGNESYKLMKKKYSFNNYYEALCNMLKKEFKINL